MNLFYFILFLSIAIPFFVKNKRNGLIISFLLLFIPWGLQYQMTQDWHIYLIRWQHVNFNERIELDGGDERILEPLYVLFMKMCKPFSFYGFLIISAILELLMFYYYTKKYVSPAYYWVTIFLLMINVKYGLLLINTNRQTLALLLFMIGLLFFDKTNLDKSSNQKTNSLNIILYFVIGIILFSLSPKVHSSSNIIFWAIPIYFFAKYVKSPNRLSLFIILNFLFLLRYFVDAQQYQFAIYLNWDKVDLEGMDFMGKYLDEIDNSTGRTIVTIIELFFMNVFIYYYNKLGIMYRIFVLLWISNFILGGFLTGSIARVTLYFDIYLIFIIPKIFELMYEQFGKKNVIVNSIWMIIFAYFIFTFVKQMTNDTEGYYYYRWNNFKTIIESPEWI